MSKLTSGARIHLLRLAERGAFPLMMVKTPPPPPPMDMGLCALMLEFTSGAVVLPPGFFFEVIRRFLGRRGSG